jgi:hypothetical protein
MSSSSSSTDTAQIKAQLARKKRNKLAQQKIRARRRSFEDPIKKLRNTLPIPLDSGLSFKVHGTQHAMANPANVGKAHRLYQLTPEAALRHLNNHGLDRHSQFEFDAHTLALSHKGSTAWSQESAAIASEAFFLAPEHVIIIAPEITYRKQLEAWPRTQVKTTFGKNGVRMCCPVCRSNKGVHYLGVHEFTIHCSGGKDKKAFDFEMCCCNPNCGGVKETLKKAFNNNKAVPKGKSITFQI